MNVLLVTSIIIFVLVVVYTIVMLIIHTNEMHYKSRYIQLQEPLENDLNQPQKSQQTDEYESLSKRYCIFLTMHIGTTTYKQLLYENRVQRWLDESPFHIYTVDSSNILLRINHPRLHQFTFDQGFKYQHGHPSVHEKHSIDVANEYFKNDFHTYQLVFKVTGKYFIPKFASVLRIVPTDADIVLQYKHGYRFQHSEIFGCKPHLLTICLKQVARHTSMEESLYDYISSIHSLHVYKLPQLELDSITTRSDGSIMLELY